MGMMRALAWLFIVVVVPAASAQQKTPDPRRQEFLRFVEAEAARLRAQDRPPATLEEWEARRKELRRHLQEAWGPSPETPCPLEATVLGTLQRDGYRVEKVLFQTRPGVWMTANAYVPDGPGKHPATLMVHGHWRGARVDPVVQSRCIGAAKLGLFVLAVDAFGAGERGVGTKLGEYHGAMTAATLLPVGLPLSGLQVYENMRALDYLLSRPEVDHNHVGITGASGGGNQSMYAGAWDDRFTTVIPVCSVGNYQAYLGRACCMCEVVPGALRFTEEGDVLGLTAPRDLMVISATRDAFQFSVAEAKKSLARAAAIDALYNPPGQPRHAIFESGHDYNKPMREAMYGWMAWHYADRRPLPEPAFKTEDPEALRCFPADTRPAAWMTIPRFAAAEARKVLAGQVALTSAEGWLADAGRRRRALEEKVFGGLPAWSPLGLKVAADSDGKTRTLTFHPEPGLTLTARQRLAGKGADVAIVLDLDGADKAAAGPLTQALGEAGWSVVTLDLRATGALAWPQDAVGAAPDHNTAEWSLWIGRPLLGQWAWDICRLLDALTEADGGLPKRVAVLGRGPAGLVALSATAIDPRMTAAASVDALASYVSDVPYQGQRLGLMAPGILREVGDVAQLAALGAPRRVVIAGGVRGSGEPLTAAQRRETFADAAVVWQRLGAGGELRLLDAGGAADVVRALR